MLCQMSYIVWPCMFSVTSFLRVDVWQPQVLICPVASHTCQHQRTKKRDRADEKVGVNVIFTTTRVHNWYCSTSSRRYTDLARATITRDIFIPSPTRSGLSRSLTNRQNTHNFAERFSFAKHWKLVAESSEFHLMLSRAHFFQLEIPKKRDILGQKRDGAKKLEFMPESGNVDTYGKSMYYRWLYEQFRSESRHKPTNNGSKHY